MLGYPTPRPRDGVFEELLVPPGLVDDLQGEREQRRQIEPRHAAQRRSAHESTQFRLGYARDHGRHRLSCAIGEKSGVFHIGQPAGGQHRQIGIAQPRRNDRGFEKVRLDEPAETGRDTILVSRNDAGVRDRQPERPLEQRDHREPVGDAADQRRLGDAS
jgi:hypothetical protein